MSFVPSDPIRVNETKEEKKVTKEDLIAKYEGVLESIYEKQTRGDYTWRGILIAFLWEYNALTPEKKPLGGPVYRGVEIE